MRCVRWVRVGLALAPICSLANKSDGVWKSTWQDLSPDSVVSSGLAYKGLFFKSLAPLSLYDMCTVSRSPPTHGICCGTSPIQSSNILQGSVVPLQVSLPWSCMHRVAKNLLTCRGTNIKTCSLCRYPTIRSDVLQNPRKITLSPVVQIQAKPISHTKSSPLNKTQTP